MNKQKTKKAAAKRFKITPTGKVLRERQMQNHLKHAKSRTARNRYKLPAQVSAVEKKTVERMLPYGE
jgi:large subunit ribosomal protein L35